MTDEERVVEEIKAAIAELPAQEQALVHAYAIVFRRIVSRDTEPARVAFALVGAELAAQT